VLLDRGWARRGLEPVKRCVACEEVFDGAGWGCPKCGFTPRQDHGIVCFAAPDGNDGFDPEAFGHLARIEHDSAWFRSRSQLICWALDAYFPGASSFLEVGCGTGFVLEWLAERKAGVRLSGVELHAGGLARASRRVPSGDFLQADARALPFRGEFDVVGAFDVLEHISEDEVVLAEMHEALGPGGGLLLTVPQHPWLWSRVDEHAQHKRRYRRIDLLAKVERAGFRVRRVTSFVTLLLPAMALSRVWERRSSAPFDPTREHQAARRLNVWLGPALSAERRLIAGGVDLPAGGSLLVVATRV
jgi:SAM-dependent methyltransferase